MDATMTVMITPNDKGNPVLRKYSIRRSIGPQASCLAGDDASGGGILA